MSNPGQVAQNFQALKKKSFDIHFDLSNTNYDPIENIGTGAYGVVCSAINCKTKEKVAIKKIPRIFEQPTIAKRTYREIKILRHFKHDNIIAIQEILQPKEEKFEDVYIVLDLMESDLHRIIHSQQPLTEEHLRYFLYQLLRGLKYIHSANVVHRDLKPSNLLINENCDLKIGDFGMARGIASNASEENSMMTQYVATRWYRAPELMLLPMAYTAAIDMWSVGCIVAEMLGRRQIFPGRDHRDQLRLIIGILGSPTSDFLKLTHSDIVRNYIQGLGVKQAESLERLYPKAAPKVLQLLKQMLVIDPRHRISVDAALEHPFLSNYHDIDDEPICIPVFNFDFEKVTLDREKLREVITQEIQSFHNKKPKPILNVFNFKPVPKEELEKSRSPPVSKAEGKLPPLEGSSSSKGGVQEGGLLAFQRLMQQQQVHQKQEPVIACSEVSTLTVSGARQAGTDKPSADIEMLSASAVQKEAEKPKASIVVDAGEKAATADVEMLSAKNKDTSGLLPQQPGTSSLSQEPAVVQPMDTKALIKAALLSSKRKIKAENAAERPRPVTALQRQREREEKRRKKKEKAQEKRKKDVPKGTAPKGISLTEEDKSLLERWKSMAGAQGKSSEQKSNIQGTDVNPTEQPHEAKQGNSVLHQGQQQGFASVQGVAEVTANQSSVVADPSSVGLGVLQVSQAHTLPQGASLDSKHLGGTNLNGTRQVEGTAPIQHLSQTIAFPGFQDTSALANNAFTSLKQQQLLPTNQSQNSDFESQGSLTSGVVPFAGYSTNPPGPANMNQQQQPFTEFKAGVESGANMAYTGTVQPGAGMATNEPTFVSYPTNNAILQNQDYSQMSQPDTQVVFNAQINPTVPVSHASTVVSNMAATVPSNPAAVASGQQPQQPAGVHCILEPEVISGDTVVKPVAPDTQVLPSEPSTLPLSSINNMDQLHVITKQMMRSHMEDLTLTQTPKGTGGGYGVGLDLDLLQPYGTSGEITDIRPESAPLSASLISDWLDVTGNMDIPDIEALQQELELGSPLDTLADFSALADPYGGNEHK